jgi:hypothetical protein
MKTRREFIKTTLAAGAAAAASPSLDLVAASATAANAVPDLILRGAHGMLITPEEYVALFHTWDLRFWFRDCVVRSKDIFVFVTEPFYTDEQVREEEENGWDPDLRPKGILAYIRYEEAGKQWSGSFKQGWQPMVIGASQKPANHSVSIEVAPTFPSMSHKCFVTGSGPAYEDATIDTFNPEKNGSDGNFSRGYIGKLKSLEGYLYACGGRRSFGKRLGKGQWQSFSQNILPPGETGGFQGFRRLERERYLCGGGLRRRLALQRQGMAPNFVSQQPAVGDGLLRGRRQRLYFGLWRHDLHRAGKPLETAGSRQHAPAFPRYGVV